MDTRTARDLTVEANRRFYAEVAETYDRTEECVTDARLRARLRKALERALREVGPGARILDACGGSGNASLMLFELGAAPVTVDVSPEMLAIFERVARRRGYEPRVHIAEIGTFLAEDERAWDLIVFSSALHHLEDYAGALELAARRLAPGGVIVTMFDPVQTGRVGRKVRRLDYVAHVFMKTPRRVPELVRRRLGRRLSAAPAEMAGERAERHALGGIDDVALGETLRRSGLAVLVHERWYEGRFALTRFVYRLLREPSSFHFLAKAAETAPSGGGDGGSDAAEADDGRGQPREQGQRDADS